MQVTEYDPVTGRLLGVWTSGDDVDRFVFPHVMGRHDTRTEYVDINGNVSKTLPRPAQGTRQDKTHIKADGEDMMTLSGLPIPCNISINGTAFDVKDGLLEMTTLLPGDYVIRAEAFPFADWEGKVTAL